MKTIKIFFSPAIILILFTVIVLLFIIINYVARPSELDARYLYVKKAHIFNFFVFLPSMAFFLGTSIFNFSVSKSRHDRKNMIYHSFHFYF